MPLRRTPLVTGEYHHILNRGVNKIPILQQKKDYDRFTTTLLFYQTLFSAMRFSIFLTQSSQKRKEFWQKTSSENQIEIVAYCLMPNHFHLLLKQTKNAGIENFLQRVAGSCSHYFNTKYKRKGPLFEGRFQAIRIESDEQLLHLSRYIHLNPYSGYVVKTLRQLEDYPYSSFPEYIEKKEVEACNKDIILEEFDTPKSYKKFVFDQADYQRSLERIKHQTLE